MARAGTRLTAAALSTALAIVAPAGPASAALAHSTVLAHPAVPAHPSVRAAAKPVSPARSSPHRITDTPDLNSAIVPGFNGDTLAADDDGSTGVVPLPFPVSYFGTTYSSLYVNNNGNLTFGMSLQTYTPQSLNQIGVPMIAPFWADVDTRAGPVVTYGYGKVDGHLAFGANWLGVGCYDEIDTVADTFQVLLISRPDLGYGDFSIEFNYGPLTWDSGQASGGNGQCLGGTAARAGYTSGFGASYELPGSGVDGGLLSDNPTTGLTSHSLSSAQPGRYILQVRGGVPQQPKFAALGDSFSSGEGTLVANFSGAPCDRGADAWPDLMTQTYPAAPPLSAASFFACTGTTTAQLSQLATGQLHQLKTWKASNGPPGLLTVTAGGDDLGFAPLLRDCWLVSPTACLRGIRARIAYLNSGAFTAVLDGVYQNLLALAGAGMQVAAVGYPLILPPPSAASDATGNQICPWLGGQAGSIFAAFQEAQLDLDNVMAQTAAADGIDFVRLGDVLAGHELCTDDPYVVDPGPLGSAAAAAGHPDRAGQLLIAQDVGSQLGFLTGTGSSGGPSRRAQQPEAGKKPDAAAPAGRTAASSPTAARPAVAGKTRQVQAAAPITIGSALPAGHTSALYTGFVWAHHSTAPDHWSVTGGSLPAGLSLDASTGIVSGTPTGHGTSSFTVTVTDSSSPRRTASATRSITVDATGKLTIPAPQLAAATAGQPYAGTLTAHGGLPPYTWSLPSGSLPAGLTLNSATGAITGTPTAAGTQEFTVTVTGAHGAAASAPVTLTVAAAGSALATGPPQLPAGAAGAGYTGTLPATGGTAPLDWTVAAGALPGGLTLDPDTGTITGVPTAAGTFTFTAQVSDASTPTQSATEPLSVTIAAAPALASTTTTLPAAGQGTPYAQTLDVSGGVAPYSWSVTSGGLPDGLSLDPADGTISGTPTTAGSYQFTVATTDSATPAADELTRTLSLTVGAALPVLGLSVTGTVTNAVENTSYQASIIPSGGIQPYTYALASGSLPSGLMLNGEAGTITGTPTATGTYQASIAVTDSSSPIERVAFYPVTITVTAAGPLAISTTSLPDAATATAYAQPLAVSGGTGADTFTVTQGTLPDGLTLDPGTGIIYGTPAEEEEETRRPGGTSTFTVTVTDSATPSPDTASVTLSLTVDPTPTLTVPAATLPAAVQDFGYSQGVYTSGGAAPYSWSVTGGALPDGLSINASTGLITGTPTGAGTATVTLTATDSSDEDPQTASQTFTLTVAPASPLTVTTVALPAATSGASYAATLDTDGGTAPVTWSVTGAALPDGLSLDQATGTISGTTTDVGVFSVTVQATDGSTPTAQTATSTLTLEVDPSPPG